MPDGDLSLLLKISGDAATAKAALDALRTKMLEVSAVMVAKQNELNAAQRPMNLSDPVRAQLFRWQASGRSVRRLMERIQERNRRALASYQQFGDGVRRTFDSLDSSLEMFGRKHTEVYGQIGATLQRAITMERREAEQSGAAALSKTRFAIGAIKQLAPVKAAEDVAKGLEALGDFNFWSAAQYFAGAAMWGVVGASQIMSMVGAAGGMGGGGRGSRSGSGRYGSGGGSGRGSDEQWTYGAESTMGQTLAPGAQPSSQSGGLTVSIMGDAQAGQWLATTLNQAVTQQGVSLVSTSSQRGAPVGR